MAEYGEIEDLLVVDNVSEHMWGNVYIKYYREEDAERAMQKLVGKHYNGKEIRAEFSPVTDFRDARCRNFHETTCNRGGFCNFMHIRHIPRANKLRLVREMYEDHSSYDSRNYKQITRQLKQERRGDIPKVVKPPTLLTLDAGGNI